MPGDNLNDPMLPRSNRTPFEWSLSALQPTAEPANGPAILFQAGRSSRDGEVRVLKIVCSVAVLLAVSMGVVGLRALFTMDEPTTAPIPTTRPTVPEIEPILTPLPGSYIEVPHVPATEQLQSAPVRPWRAMEQPKADEPSHADAKDVAEMLYYRRNLLNTGLGLLPTDGPDLTPAAPTRSEK
jgi:hypothetical protein